MKLSAVLICLGLQMYLGLGKNWPRTMWLNDSIALMEKWLVARGWQAHTRITRYAFVLLIISISALLVGLICVLICSFAWGLVGVVYSVGVLLLCLIPQPWLSKQATVAPATLETETVASEQDLSAAKTKKEVVVPPHLIQGADAVTSLQQDFFSVLFWYIIFGPFGAMASYLSSFFSRATFSATETQVAAKQIQAVIVWLPTRLLLLTLSLAGQFMQTFQALLKGVVSTWGYETQKTWVMSALKAASGDAIARNKPFAASVITLLQRTLLIWLVLLALLTITAWVA